MRHAIHSILIVFPLRLLSAGVIFDVIYLVRGGAQFALVTYWIIIGRIIGGIAAAPFGGSIDLPFRKIRAPNESVCCTAGNVIVLLLFADSWRLQHQTASGEAPALGYVLSFAGFALAALTGWLGGELIDRLGIGIDDGAHLDAPSSLSDRSANHATQIE